jgi:hypothetical protein
VQIELVACAEEDCVPGGAVTRDGVAIHGS